MTRAEERRQLLGLPRDGLDVGECHRRSDELADGDSNDEEISGLRELLGLALAEIGCLRADLREKEQG